MNNCARENIKYFWTNKDSVFYLDLEFETSGKNLTTD